MMVFHGSTKEGITGILRDKKVQAYAWANNGSGENGFYAVGFKVWEKHPTWNQEELVRKIAMVDNGNKDRCGIIIEAKVCNEYRKIPYGGICTEQDTVSKDITTVYDCKTYKRYCVSPDAHLITAIWIIKEPAHDGAELSWLEAS